MKYDIQKNPAPISSEQISKHKNFDALFAQFEANPQPDTEVPDNSIAVEKVSKLPRWVGWSAGLAAASIAVFLVVKNVMVTPQIQNVFPAPLALQSPIELQKPFATFSVNNSDTMLTSNTGSTIKIPAAAFVDKSGRPVQGKVDIQYREMHDHVDMFLAGLPQTPKHKNRQTAAAIQIQGYQNGEPVYVGTGKNLEVALRTTLPETVPAEKLQVFAYDAPKDEWSYQATDRVEVIKNQPVVNNANPNTDSVIINNNQPKVKTEAEAIAEIRKKYPKLVPPAKQNTNTEDREVFDIEFDTKEFPEFASYQNIRWIATQKDIPYTKADANRSWSEMAITKNGDGSYQLFLKDNIGELRFAVSPIAANKAEAEKLYQTQLADYEKQKANQELAIAAELATWRKSQSEPNNNPNTIGEQIVIHHFTISQFGLWACTNENPVLETETLALQNVDNLQQIYFAAPESRFYQSSSVENRVFPKKAIIWATDKSQNLLVGSLQNDKLVFNPINPSTENELRKQLQSKEYIQ